MDGEFVRKEDMNVLFSNVYARLNKLETEAKHIGDFINDLKNLIIVMSMKIDLQPHVSFEDTSVSSFNKNQSLFPTPIKEGALISPIENHMVVQPCVTHLEFLWFDREDPTE